jgi:transposase-like protein
MDAVIAALSYAGPPVTPVEGYSEDVTEVIVKAATGRAQFSAASWVTYPWTCVRIDVPSVPMGRPILLPSSEEGSPPTFRLDHQSATFQRRIGAAMRALQITSPTGRCVVHSASSPLSSFIAWRDLDPDLDGDPTALPGDVDNYAKNTLDGMQRARVLRNDRVVMRLSSIKTPVSEFGVLPTLDERLLAAAHAALPGAETASVEELDEARRALGTTRAQMHAWFPHYPLKARARRRAEGTPTKGTPAKPRKKKAKDTADSSAEYAEKRAAVCQLARTETPWLSVAEIAATAGVSRNTVAKWLKLEGIARKRTKPKPPPRSAADPEKRALVVSLGADPKLSVSEIARRAHVHRATAAAWLAPVRPSSTSTMAEKRTAALALHAEYPQMSLTEIATRIGSARSTVTRWIEAPVIAAA